MTGNRIISRVAELLAEKERREKRRISYRVLAKEAGVSESSAYSWWTNSVTRFDTPQVLAFCRYFNCDISDLLQIDHSPEVQTHG